MQLFSKYFSNAGQKDGYRLAGWLDENGSIFDFDTAITTDITLTANWIENVVNIKFINVSSKTKSNVNDGDVWCVRAYLLYSDENGEHTVYSDDMVKASLNPIDG